MSEQWQAGFRSMQMLAGFVQRGGKPAAVAPTIALRDGERQYGWFPVTVGGERRVAVITNLRLIVGVEVPLWSITRIRPGVGRWSVALDIRGRGEPVVLGGPWVPWLCVVICAELYGAAWPPSRTPIERKPTNRAAIERKPTGRAAIERKPTGRAAIERKPTDRAAIGRKPTDREPIEKATKMKRAFVDPNGLRLRP